MESRVTRSLTQQLADDLGWLENHCGQQPEQAVQAAHLRLTAALVRNCLGPFLDDQPAAPLHVAVVGGAGAGKSTVANLLSGAALAEANPQAGFTRHPIAYASTNGALGWTGHLGFLGPLQRLAQPSPASLDADVYQVRAISAEPEGFSLLKQFVIWDCPDMTTWAAAGYVPRLLEIAALADIAVYVASDERYNDEVPTQFLQLLLQAGKPVIVCLVKMKEADAPALLAHFHREVQAKLPPGIVASLAIPFLTPAELADPLRQAARHRVPLLNQVAVLGESAVAARRRSIRGAGNFLLASCDHLLTAARNDMAALQSWRGIVHAGQVDFDNRYRREYLYGEKFHRFDEALVRLLDLLELPGVGRVLSNALWVVRTPFRLLKEFATKALRRPDTPNAPELPMLEQALSGWLDLLLKEAARRADSHPLWAHIEKGFVAGGLAEQARQRFQQYFREFQAGMSSEVDQTARAIYEELEKNPAMLATLRGGKFAIDVAAIAGTLAAGGINWHDVFLVPLAAFISQQLVELLGRQYVDNQRELARQRQQALVTKHISGPLADWLAQWPATGGSTYERLQEALRRIPLTVEQVERAVTEKLNQGAGRAT